MNRQRAFLRVWIVLIALAAGRPLAAAVPALARQAPPGVLVPTDLGTLGGLDTFGHAINDRGQIVGGTLAPGDVLSAFLWDSGTTTDLGAFYAAGINNRGQILLQEFVAHPDDPDSCFLRDGSDLIDLGTPGGSNCFAADLNDRGQVVGTVQTFQPSIPFHVSHAFLWDSGTLVELGSLGGGWSSALAVNDRGQVVGGSNISEFGAEHAFLWEAGRMIDIGPTEGSSRAFAINNRGQVVVSNGWQLLLWEHGSLVNLTPDATPPPPPTVGGSVGSVTYLPLDINDRGQILIAVYDPGAAVYRYGLWESGVLTLLPSLGGGQPIATHMNDRGQVVGMDRLATGGLVHAVLWTSSGGRGRDSR